MAALGFCENYLRSPLTCMEEANYKRLIDEMRKIGLKV
jgi:hypothetical protein